MRKLLSNNRLLILFAVLTVIISFFVSLKTCMWHWFGRSGAIMTMVGIMLSIRPLVRMGRKEWVNFLGKCDGGNFVPTPEDKENERQAELDAKAFQFGSVLLLIGTLIWAYGDLFGGLPK